jgi:hypothetical protein
MTLFGKYVLVLLCTLTQYCYTVVTSHMNFKSNLFNESERTIESILISMSLRLLNTDTDEQLNAWSAQ